MCCYLLVDMAVGCRHGGPCLCLAETSYSTKLTRHPPHLLDERHIGRLALGQLLPEPLVLVLDGSQLVTQYHEALLLLGGEVCKPLRQARYRCGRLPVKVASETTGAYGAARNSPSTAVGRDLHSRAASAAERQTATLSHLRQRGGRIAFAELAGRPEGAGGGD